MSSPSQVESLFFAALEKRTADERNAFLEAACDDIEVRRQVKKLLNAHPKVGNFLQKPGVPQMYPSTVASDPTRVLGATDDQGVEDVEDTDADGFADEIVSLDFLEPSTRPDSLGRLGHYEVLQVLGKGGFGIVFRAFDEILQRVVAVKVLGPRLAATSPPRKRFLREARSSAKVRHENIVQVYAVEEQPLPYLVMEFIPGETLQQRLNRTGPLETAEVVQMGRQIAEGLAAAHAQGLIHRDIKPANILIEAGPRACVKITDFGLARAADDASLSQSGVIVGTPMFMAPEQALGHKLDHRADLFSLGSVLYTMCSGRPPFRANGTLAVLKRVAEDTPRPIPEIIPEVPQWLCQIITRLHAKNPEDRFAGAKDVADALTRGLLYGPKEERSKSVPIILEGEELSSDSVTQADVSKLVPPKGSRFQFSRLAIVAAGLLLCVMGLGFTEASGVTNVHGTIIRLFSPEGTLVVEVDDPAVSIKIDGSDLVITGAGAKEIRLKAGNHTVEAHKDGKVVSQELITVTQNDRRIVRVSQVAPSADPKTQERSEPASDWAQSVAAMPAAAQVEEVRKELQKRNLDFKGRIEHTLVDGRVHSLTIDGHGMVDLLPLRGLSDLHTLSLNCPLVDISSLRGMGLTDVSVFNSHVSDLSPLEGMKLRQLNLAGSHNLVDLSPLQGMPLNYLTIYGTQVSDLTPLKGMPLKYLNCDNSKVSDLTPLQGTPLQGMPLEVLNLNGSQVSDLSPLKDLPLINLFLTRSQVTDLSPIQTLSLKVIHCDFHALRDAKILRAVTSLETINQKPAAQFWSDYQSEWQRTVATLPAEEQLQAFRSRMRELNPDFDGSVEFKIEQGVVTELKFQTEHVSDISPVSLFTSLNSINCFPVSDLSKQGLLKDLSPLQGLPLKRLRIVGSPMSDLSPLKGMALIDVNIERTRVTDLTPLQGMPLRSLNIYTTLVADLSPLKGMPLVSLQATGTPIADLSPLRGMPLEILQCVGSRVSDLSPLKESPLQVLLCDLSQVSDLSPLQGRPLRVLGCSFTRVSDLLPLKGMSLHDINVGNTKVSDLALLKEMPLKVLTCDFQAERDTEILRAIPTLERINNKPIAQFWKDVEAPIKETDPKAGQ